MCTSSPSVKVSLPFDASAPGLIRDSIERAVCQALRGGVLDAALLCGSEVVTNAVRYGAAPITCEIECDQVTGLVVRVRDEGPTAMLPSPGAVGLDQVDRAATGGRGLGLVAVLSDQWGIEADRYGKTVWFRLHAPAGN